MKIGILLAGVVLAGAGVFAQAQNAPSSGTEVLAAHDVAARLAATTGVWHKAPGTTMPNYVADPTWPQPLPNNWLLGQVGGLYVDSQNHVWIFNRPRTMSNDEAGLEKAIPGATNAKGQPVNGLGDPRPYGTLTNCCNAAPSVLEFDQAGKLLRAWGGPSDPGWLEKNCKAEDGCIWPNNEHGIYVDDQGNVWLSGNGSYRAPIEGQETKTEVAPWVTNRQGADGFILKFDPNGKFLMRIGGIPPKPDSNATTGGMNGTPLMNQPADMLVDAKTNRLYVADGYTNRRVLILDATTGKYIGHFGAYGSNPVSDTDNSNWSEDREAGRKPAVFRSPLHCVKLANDGKLYVCDRGNDRIQVFNTRDPNLGKACTNPNAEAGKCGFLGETYVSPETEAIPYMTGTVAAVALSSDAAQSCLYVGDLANQSIYILNRSNMTELGRLGHSGRMVGDFRWVHQFGVDGQGNVYTSEVNDGKRVQKFLRYGPMACSGTGFTSIGDFVE